jgi:hypothetical protein
MRINKWIIRVMAFCLFAGSVLAGKPPSTSANPANSKDKKDAIDKTTTTTTEDPDSHKNNIGLGHFKAIGKGHHKNDVSATE